MTKWCFILFLFASFVACSENDTQTEVVSDSEKIIAQAITAAGGDLFENSRVAFEFRGVQYVSEREGGLFQLSRIRTDSAGNTIHDKLTNDGFTRTINDSLVTLPDSLSQTYSNSVNSVHYFAQLPYGLRAEAVQSNLLDTVSIAGTNYYKIEVTFQPEGGGTDHEDIFLYWFDTTDYSMDFLAYKFHTDGGGMRFREAYNVREVSGIRFADYRNMVIENPQTDQELFFKLDSLYQAGQLELLSNVELKQITVDRSLP